jgi:pyruvate,water dikinase
VVVVEAEHGLGEAVVGGEVHPDLFEVNKVTGAVHHRALGTKAAEYRLTEDRRAVEVRPVAPDRRAAWAIADEELAALVGMALDLERQIGRGLDVEWAIGTIDGVAGGERLYALQVRPITVDRRPAAGAGLATATPIDAVLGRLGGGPARGSA